MSQKILLIEDDADLARGLEINLRAEGYSIVRAATGEQGIRLAFQQNPNLVMLDVMLPGINGFDVCRNLRQKGFEAPIILLTAKAEEIDRVVGLELGADDYVAKPFSLRELLARVRARLRRVPEHSATGISRYRFGSVEIDFERCQATRAGKPFELTGKEYDIMRLLIRHRGEVISRDRMLNEIWGYESSPTTRTVDNHILRLRQKLEEDPTAPQFILSMYGEGYRFVG